MNIEQARKLEEYIQSKSAVKGGGLFCSVIITSDVSMNKNKRLTEQEKEQGVKSKDFANPYASRLVKITDIAGDCMVTQSEYEKLVNNRRKKEGLEPDFKAEKPSGRHHIEGYQSITQADKDPNQYYQSLYFLKEKGRVNVRYELDGHEVSVTKDSDFANYLTPSFFEPHEEGGKQGLENPIVIRTPKLESIKKVKVGEYNFSE